MTQAIKDLRSLSQQDEPYSAYCKICWNPVYSLWIDKVPHFGKCQEGESDAIKCTDAQARVHFAIAMRRAKAAAHPRDTQ